MRHLILVGLLLVAISGCSRDKSAAIEPDPALATEVAEAGSGAEPAPEGADPDAAAPLQEVSAPNGGGGQLSAAGALPTTRELYGACRERVEGEEADGECSSDADCARAGCGREVCTTAAKVSDVMSTCEVRPCFAVLDTCGCVAGRCQWSVVEELSPSLQRELQKRGGMLKPAEGVPPASSGPQ